MSIVFALFFFGGHQLIDLGCRAVVLDLMPQSFAVGLMSFLIPTLLTRRRCRSGKLRPQDGTHILPRNVLVRSALVGVVTAAVSTAAYAALGPLPGLNLETLNHFVMLKAAFGAILSIILTPIALYTALRDPC
jgi:hypothetical protein